MLLLASFLVDLLAFLATELDGAVEAAEHFLHYLLLDPVLPVLLVLLHGVAYLLPPLFHLDPPPALPLAGPDALLPLVEDLDHVPEPLHLQPGALLQPAVDGQILIELVPGGEYIGRSCFTEWKVICSSFCLQLVEQPVEVDLPAMHGG